MKVSDDVDDDDGNKLLLLPWKKDDVDVDDDSEGMWMVDCG